MIPSGASMQAIPMKGNSRDAMIAAFPGAGCCLISLTESIRAMMGKFLSYLLANLWCRIGRIGRLMYCSRIWHRMFVIIDIYMGTSYTWVPPAFRIVSHKCADKVLDEVHPLTTSEILILK